MSTTRLPCIPSVRKQQLHLEFASLRRALPPGVYVSLAPADPTLWNGVIFVRHGPYASAILRFHIRFPDIYPDLPPLVTFTTDLFHPLIVPLTTYTFSTGSASDNPVSATDDERLPPGGFSLRHGFPHWFGRAKRSGLASGASSRNVSGGSAGTANTATKGIPESAGFITEETAPADASDDQVEDPENIDQSEEPPRVAQVPSINQFVETRKSVPVAELLDYIRSTFDDETVLDSLPVDVAGNPGAWHAWKAHRRGADSFGRSRRESPQARRPGDWHWDGIWARRVQDEIEASHSEPMLFGNAARGGGDETIRFSRLGDATLSSVKEKMESVVNFLFRLLSFSVPSQCYSLARSIAAADSIALCGSPRAAAARVTEERRRRDFDRISKAPLEIEIPRPLSHRLSMKSLSPAWSRSRRLTAADESPGPLTVRRCNESRSQSTLPSSSYPRIPRRSSSLSTSERKGSDEPTTSTSTRTPSLSDSLYQIEVTKIRQSKSPIHRGADYAKTKSNDDPFIDNNAGQISDIRMNWARKGYRLAPQLVVRWSSGSWNSPGPSARFSNGTLSASRISAPAPQQPRPEHTKRGEFDSLRPMDLPVAFVNLRATTDQLQIGMGQTSLWATVYVSADVSPTPFPGASSIAPLDIMILLDSLAQPSITLLTQVTVGTSVLVSHLSHSHDRFALAYIDQNSKHGFEMLLPLGFHAIGAVRSALNIFSSRQLAAHQKASLDIGNVVQGASEIFSRSPRAAFCHIFFVSATPPDHLLIPWIDPAIGFHTITPQTCLPLDNANSQLGWHISYTVGACDAGPRETHFIRRILRVIRQLRTGINPGCVIDLKLSVTPGDGCQIQSVIEDCRLISLRPGETWSIPVQICVPAVVDYPSETQQSSPFYEHPFIEEMMAQINALLCEYSSNELFQHLLTVHVEYQHSLLPVPTTINVENHLTITRQNYKTLSDPQSSELSMGSFSQDSDFSFSQHSTDSS